MNDIVERLRDSDTTRRIGESYADVHDRRQADRDEAADTITRLRYDLADAITEQQWQRGKADDLGKLASSLTARVRELEEALNPFADESLWSGPDHEFVTVKRSDCDRARSAITKGEER